MPSLRRRPAAPAHRACGPNRDTPRRALVTGAASGLGLALTRLLVERGDQVLATDLAAERPAGLPAEAAYRRLDVREEADWLAAREAIETDWGGLDLLVNNAGIAAGGRIDRLGEDSWERIVDINLLGVVRGCRVFTPVMARQGDGQLVNVASMAGLCHAPRMASYNATKAAVVALSETLDHELRGEGIAVSVVCPFFFASNLAESLDGSDPDADAAAARLIGRARTSPETIAARVLAGIDARRDVILTDPMGRLGWYGKRFARPVYRRLMSVPGPLPGLRKRLGWGL